MAAQVVITRSAGAHRRSRASIDLSSGPAGWGEALVGGRLAPVFVDPGMSIGGFLSNEIRSCSRSQPDPRHVAR
jgi:hypothetical protein